ncbi:TauD/TfdA family dioxygenase [Streptomyces sp. NPDC048361]|uniref:TauD/TfdA family dioxygenase n=1 Tax=Streptomyces sp. NPDC048361 TaxID=3154720 RepID=UPI003440E299
MTAMTTTAPTPLVSPPAEAPAAAVRGPRRRALAPGRRLPATRLIGPALVLVLWAAASAAGQLDPAAIPAPWTVLRTAGQLWSGGTLSTDVLTSLERAGYGFALGLTAGVVLALASGLSRTGEALIDGTVQLNRAIPTLGLIPLFILWLGIGETFKIAIIAIVVYVPIYLNLHAALSGIDHRYVELADRSLPQPLRQFADTLWAEHTNDYDYAVPEEDVDAKKAEQRAQFTSITFRTAHPVVRVHPLTGERGLFIGGFAQRIVGLSVAESRTVLDLLQTYVVRPENILRHRWSPNQLVLFDNRITQHYAIDNYDGLPRRLNRVTVAGDVPVGIDGKESYSIAGDASHYTSVAPV